jgi:hypothetical protein
MVIQIKCILPAIAPELLDVLSLHSSSEEMSTEPMPACMAGDKQQGHGTALPSLLLDELDEQTRQLVRTIR